MRTTLHEIRILFLPCERLYLKNQVVIPKEARQAMGVKGGDELLIVVKNDLMPVMSKFDLTGAIGTLYLINSDGCLPRK